VSFLDPTLDFILLQTKIPYKRNYRGLILLNPSDSAEPSATIIIATGYNYFDALALFLISSTLITQL